MKCADKKDYEVMAVKTENIINLPQGLLGFEDIHRYVLLNNANEAPFQWLQVIDDQKLAFLVIPPNAILPSYQPEIGAEDVRFLGLNNPDDALVYNICTLHRDGRATVNLRGPIVLNRRTLVGKQVVITNALDYDLQHPLPLAV